jgi:RHS repeat-associated protein
MNQQCHIQFSTNTHQIPFGEDWVDQRNSSWNAPYTFSGKEKDAETGYNYFGARYYDSKLSLWLSVDPMSDKYPSMNPYNYCANNPVILVDPDREDIYTFDETGNLVDHCEDETGFDQVNVIKNDGTLIEGDKYDYGTITNEFSEQMTQKNGTVITVPVFNIKGDENADIIFKFVANNTGVEWSRAAVGKEEGSNGANYLNTTREIDHIKCGKTVSAMIWREQYHNHPSGTFAISWEDKQASTTHENARFFLYTKEYGSHEYNSSGFVSDEDQIYEIQRMHK